MSINSVLKQIKQEYDSAITTRSFNGKTYQNGSKAKEALIRSQKVINYLHEHVKEELLEAGVNNSSMYPPVGCSKPEVKLAGFLKNKNQDISVIPRGSFTTVNNLSSLKEVEKILSINVRSQMSSLSKNIDTLYERTFAEALNLHLSHPAQCLGEVYLIPTHEYDDKAMERNQVAFKNLSKIEDYIRMFQAINKRDDTATGEYKYERVALLIVDFRNSNPILYSSIEQLKQAGLVSQSTELTMDNLNIENFAADLLSKYAERFDGDLLT
jgi:hypothetical protein